MLCFELYHRLQCIATKFSSLVLTTANEKVYSEMDEGISRKNDAQLKYVFRAMKDSRTFRDAPKLVPSHGQQNLAEGAFLRVREKLPTEVVKKLVKRFNVDGHYINTVRYYPFPIIVNEGSKDFIHDLIAWGKAYASIVKKVAEAYRKPDKSYCRRFLYVSLIRYFPPHLLHLLESYRTLDDLAGAHLGDDNIGGKSVEWNLGAVGGLDEGFLAAAEIARSRETTNGKIDKVVGPVEHDAVETIRDALHWAYESFCSANHIQPGRKPRIAYVEYDDIYGSTVSICERMRELGENISLYFTHELTFRDGKLLTASGQPIDLVFMDCHLEDLHPRHPVLEAAGANRVALDCSPFAHLVLRSKAIFALLSSPPFLKHLGLDEHERRMLQRHLAATYLWRRKTFKNGELSASDRCSCLAFRPEVSA